MRDDGVDDDEDGQAAVTDHARAIMSSPGHRPHLHRAWSKGEKDTKAERSTAAVDRLEIARDHSHRDGAAKACTPSVERREA